MLDRRFNLVIYELTWAASCALLLSWLLLASPAYVVAIIYLSVGMKAAIEVIRRQPARHLPLERQHVQ